MNHRWNLVGLLVTAFCVWAAWNYLFAAVEAFRRRHGGEDR